MHKRIIHHCVVFLFTLAQVCHANPSERARFIRCIYNLLQSSSPAVKYEAAGTLVTLSSAPTAIKVEHQTPGFRQSTVTLNGKSNDVSISACQAAAQCYIDLIIKESDNNVKLIVLDRLIELKEHPTHERVLQVCSCFFCKPIIPRTDLISDLHTFLHCS